MKIVKITLLAVILQIATILGINAEIIKGNCGDKGNNVTYTLDTEAGTLNISGNGNMQNYDFWFSVPWLDHRHKIKRVTISNGITNIGDWSFNDFLFLTSVSIPNSVTTIGRNAFSNCHDLTSINISKDVTSIGGYAFYQCYSLKNINIPDGVTTIEDGVFYSCIELSNVNIPDGVKTIGGSAFNNCRALTSINIPDRVTTIGESAFNNCIALTSINIPDGVTTIKAYTFKGCCSLTSISILDGVTSIEEAVFDGCSGLTSIYLYGDKIKECMYNSFEYQEIFYPDNVTLYVPTHLIEEYKEISPWNEFHMEEIPTNFVFPNNQKTYAGKNVTISLMMNNNVEVTGYQCDVYLPEGVTFVKDEEGYEKIELSTKRTTSKNTDYFSYRMQSTGAMRILCSSTRSKTFSGNEGEVATMTVHVDKNLTPGEYPVILKNIVLSDPNAKTYRTDEMQGILTVNSYALGDANGDEEINVGDYTAIANHIQGDVADTFIEDAADTNMDGIIDVGDLTGVANIILSANENTSNARAAAMPQTTDETTYNNLADYDNAVYPTEAKVQSDGTATISVCMKNSVEVTGYQFDMYLPEGFTYAKDEDDYEMIELSTKRTTKRKTDFFSYRMQKSGAMRVLCSSTTSKTFSGNDGEVCTVVVKAPEGVKAGSYPVVLKNIVMSDPKAKTYKAENLMANIVVSDETGIEGISINNVNNCRIYSVDGSKRQTLGRGTNIIKSADGKVLKVMK